MSTAKSPGMLDKAKGMYGSIRLRAGEEAAYQVLNLMPSIPGAQMATMIRLMKKSIKDQCTQNTVETMAKWVEEGHPFSKVLRRMIKDLRPSAKRALVTWLFRGVFGMGEQREAYQAKYGHQPPKVVLISPTMACNMKCIGCYAAEYERQRKYDMPREVLEKTIQDCRDMGVKFITLLGGEPFLYPDLLDVCEKNNDCVFMVFTNGTMIDKAIAKRVGELGNVAPVLSIEGWETETDARRGAGTFATLMRAMDNLKEEKVFFGYSVCHTILNSDTIISDAFMDMLVDKGAFFGWYFNYTPVGRDPDIGLMPTPEQRDNLRRGVIHIRNTRPVLPVDFWGDGYLVSGCLAGGRMYCHINNKGDVEPCIFVHFADSNVKDMSLAEALHSPFLNTWRANQPFGHNFLRPCPICDHPEMLRKFVKETGARPTHPDADCLINEFAPQLDAYAAAMARKYGKVWQEEYDWQRWWKCDNSGELARQEAEQGLWGEVIVDDTEAVPARVPCASMNILASVGGAPKNGNGHEG